MRVLIVEDHGLLAYSLAAALRGLDDVTVDVVEVAGQAVDLPATIAERAPDLVLLDLDLGDFGSGLSLIEAIRAQDRQVIMLTGVKDPVRRAECVEAGALGVVSKSSPFDVLAGAVGRVASGGALLTRHEREEQLQLLREHRRAEHDRLATFEQLTPREAYVLGRLMDGKRVNEIAADSYVSVATVRSQVRSILSKLGVRSQVAAISIAQREGWTPDP